MKPFIFFRIVLCLSVVLAASYSFSQKTKPVAVIFDSDMGPDYDDVGAIALLHALADSGQAKILATIASTKYEGVASVFQLLNIYFNRPHLPIGVPKGHALELRDWQHWTDSLLAYYPHSIKNNNEVPDAVAVYPKTLAAQPDKSVTLITVGFLTNLALLLQSPSDHISSLTSADLVRKKVKLLVCMASKFPAGKEFNVEKDAAASQVVFSAWPTPILLSGFEIGEKIKTGLPLIQNKKVVNNPVQDVFRISIPKAKEDSAGRMSWDQTAVLVAIKGYHPFYAIKKGQMMVSADGSNTWSYTKGNHAYLVEAMPSEKVQSLINRLMMHQPVKKK